MNQSPLGLLKYHVVLSSKTASELGRNSTVNLHVHLLPLTSLPISPEVAGLKNPPCSLGDGIRNGKTEWVFPTEITRDEPITIALEQIKTWFPDADLDTHILGFTREVVPDRENSPPRYPSNMVDELRRSNIPEETIQELLGWEREIRNHPPIQTDDVIE